MQERYVVLMGEWNAYTGHNKELRHGTIRTHGLTEELNVNGKRVIVYCINNHLLIKNTRFPHKNGHSITYDAEHLAHEGIKHNKSTEIYSIKDANATKSAELRTPT